MASALRFVTTHTVGVPLYTFEKDKLPLILVPSSGNCGVRSIRAVTGNMLQHKHKPFCWLKKKRMVDISVFFNALIDTSAASTSDARKAARYA